MFSVDSCGPAIGELKECTFEGVELVELALVACQWPS